MLSFLLEHIVGLISLLLYLATLHFNSRASIAVAAYAISKFNVTVVLVTMRLRSFFGEGGS